MTTENDGGPAFPIVCYSGVAKYQPGMSLRDWFAAMAFAVLTNDSGDPEAIARFAYRISDAMLKERNERN